MTNEAKLLDLQSLPELAPDYLAWDLVLPAEAPTERIGLHLGHLARTMRLGGVGTLHVSNLEPAPTQHFGRSSEDHQDTPAVLQITSPLARFFSRTPFPEYDWSDTTIKLNTAEMATQLEGRNHSLSDPNGWSVLLNRGLTSGLRQASQNQLITKGKIGLTGFMLVLGILNARLFGGKVDSLKDARDMLEYSAGVQTLNVLWAQTYGHRLADRRLSIFPGFQLDRAAVTFGALSVRKLIKPLRLQSIG